MGVNKQRYLNEVMNLQFYGVVAKQLTTREDLDIYSKYIFTYIVSEGDGWQSSRNNLAKNLGLHQETVTKYIKILEEKNILKVKLGRSRSWHFEINPPSEWSAPQTGPKTDQSTIPLTSDLPDVSEVIHHTAHILRDKETKRIVKGAIAPFQECSAYLVNVSHQLQERWLEKYGDAAAIVAKIKDLQDWELANPKRAKKNKGAFINNCLSRDFGGKVATPKAQKGIKIR